MTMPTMGSTISVKSVSCQFRYSIQPKLAAMASELRTDAAKDEHTHDREREVARLVRVWVLEIADDRDDQPRHDEIAGGHDHHSDYRNGERPPVRADVVQQAQVEIQAGGHGNPVTRTREARARCGGRSR